MGCRPSEDICKLYNILRSTSEHFIIRCVIECCCVQCLLWCIEQCVRPSLIEFSTNINSPPLTIIWQHLYSHSISNIIIMCNSGVSQRYSNLDIPLTLSKCDHIIKSRVLPPVIHSALCSFSSPSPVSCLCPSSYSSFSSSCSSSSPSFSSSFSSSFFSSFS